MQLRSLQDTALRPRGRQARCIRFCRVAAGGRDNRAPAVEGCRHADRPWGRVPPGDGGRWGIRRSGATGPCRNQRGPRERLRIPRGGGSVVWHRIAETHALPDWPLIANPAGAPDQIQTQRYEGERTMPKKGVSANRRRTQGNDACGKSLQHLPGVAWTEALSAPAQPKLCGIHAYEALHDPS